MRIKHDLVPLAMLDRSGPEPGKAANFRLERSEVEGRIEQTKRDLAEAKADTTIPPEYVAAKIAYYQDELKKFTGLMEKVDAAGGSYAYMPQNFSDTFHGLSAPARALAVDLAMVTGKLEGDFTVAEVNKVMLAELGAPKQGPGGSVERAWERAQYAEVIRAIEQATAKQASPSPQRAGVPSGGSPLMTRMQSMTAPKTTLKPKAEPRAEATSASGAQQVALASIASKVPRAEALGQSIPDALAGLVKQQLLAARSAGEQEVYLRSDALDGLLAQAYGKGTAQLEQGYAAMAAVLGDLGYSATSSADDGIRLQARPDQGDAPAPSVDQFLKALGDRLPAPPQPGDANSRLGELIRHKLHAALASGDNEVSLETGELDGALKPAFDRPSLAYDSVATELKKLGYQANSDGFGGVSASWDATSTPALAPDSLMSALSKSLAPAARDAADQLADLVRTKIEGAQREGRKDFDLETKELDSILQPIFGAGYKGYEAVAKQLVKQGYQAFADGFIGVNAGW